MMKRRDTWNGAATFVPGASLRSGRQAYLGLASTSIGAITESKPRFHFCHDHWHSLEDSRAAGSRVAGAGS